MGKKHLMVKGAHDFEKRGCEDCKNCEENINCWCISKKAVELRKTHQCGMEHCPFWEPCLHINDVKNQKWYNKLFHSSLDDYKKIEGKEN